MPFSPLVPPPIEAPVVVEEISCEVCYDTGTYEMQTDVDNFIPVPCPECGDEPDYDPPDDDYYGPAVDDWIRDR